MRGDSFRVLARRRLADSLHHGGLEANIVDSKQIEISGAGPVASVEIGAEEQSLLGESILGLTSELASSQPLTAPVELPNRGELTVKLVNRTVLQRLDELRGDISIYQGFFFTALGALISFGIATFPESDKGLVLDRTNLIASALALGFLVTFGWLWARAAKRAKVLYDQVFSN